MGTAMQAFGEAMQAAAAPQTGTPCEQAHASFGVMMQALATKMPGRNFPPPTPREEFLRACNALPEPMQRCLIIGHAMANAEQCRALKDQLDPETRARIQALITPGRGRAAAAPPSPTPTP